MRTYQITPTLLGFPWKACPYCVKARVCEGWKPPFQPLPKVLNRMDKLMRQAYSGADTALLTNGLLPTGTLNTKERSFKSKPIQMPEFPDVELVLSCRTDAIATFANASHAVIDFKTADPTGDLSIYKAQLHICAHAMENPQKGEPIKPVEIMGLLTLFPESLVWMPGNCKDLVNSDRKFTSILRDNYWFTELLTGVMMVLVSDVDINAECPSCLGRKYKLLDQSFTAPT
jgi:hypothetical protein